MLFMDVTVLLPQTIEAALPVTAIPPRPDNDEGKKEVLNHETRQQYNAECLPPVLLLPIDQSRTVWRVLYPCIFDSNISVARKAIRCILSLLRRQQQKQQQRQRTLPEGLLTNAVTRPQINRPSTSTECYKNASTTMMLSRRLRIPPNPNKNNAAKVDWYVKLLLWIQPPTETRLEYSFTGRLLTWEHKLIQAQSMMGYLATLGGGFFFCHHFRTAYLLAEQQKRMALILNNSTVYYQCLVNEAYNLMYAGSFRKSRKLIRQVREMAQGMDPVNKSLIQICDSAMLFHKRMQKAQQDPEMNIEPHWQEQREQLSQQQQQPLLQARDHNGGTARGNGSLLSKTMDDLARIRIIHDQSKHDDLTVPFRPYRYL